MLLYTVIVLSVLGADGADCPIQLEMWRSVYNITFFEAYLFIAAGGYVGTLLASSLAMLVSARSRSTATATHRTVYRAVRPPVPEQDSSHCRVFCSLFPDQLLEIYVDLKESALIEIGGKVMTTAMLILPVYTAVCVILQPVLYSVYRRTQIR